MCLTLNPVAPCQVPTLLSRPSLIDTKKLGTLQPLTMPLTDKWAFGTCTLKKLPPGSRISQTGLTGQYQATKSPRTRIVLLTSQMVTLG
jgi:hypothetical protein